jgi:superfamily II DNA or RNA helicase
MNYISRYYQRDAIDAVEWSWEGCRKNLINLATGAGKNFIMANIVRNVQPRRCLVIGDQNELVNQPVVALSKFGGIIAAVEQAQKHASIKARNVVASAQSLHKKSRLERFPRDHFDAIFIDESHRNPDMKAAIFDYFETAKVCGMTATPFRADMLDLSEWYDDVAYRKPMSKTVGDETGLIEEGFAPPMRILTLPVEIDLSGLKTGMTPDGKEYKADDTAKAILPYLDAVAALLAEHAKGRHGIAWLPLISISQEFVNILRKHGITARHVDGSSADREQILEGFARGEFSWLCNAALVSTGVDLPIADCFLNLSPMHSHALYQQRAGRVLRPLPGVIDDLPEFAQAHERRGRIARCAKPDAVFFDLLWQHDKLSVMRPAALVAESAEEAAAISEYSRRKLSAEDLAEIKARVQEEKEMKLVSALEKAAARIQGKELIPFSDAAVLIGDRALINYEPTQKWELDKPITAQLAEIARRGVNPASVRTKGQANALLHALQNRYEQRLATLKQVRFMYSLNASKAPSDKFKNPERLTLTEASALLDAEMSRRKLKPFERV